MKGGGWRLVCAAALTIATMGAAGGSAAERLSHRVWLLRGVPDETSLTALRDGGIDGLVVPVGEVVVGSETCRLTLAPLGDLAATAGWPVTPLVWVSGEGEAAGGAKTLLNELAPVARLLHGTNELALAARAPWPGLLAFARSLGEHGGGPVELVVPARSLAGLELERLPAGVRLNVVALGNPPALDLPAAPPGDDLENLERLDSTGVRYRVAVVVSPIVTPPPGPRGASLAHVAQPTAAEYRPADRGDDFLLRRPLDWGGVHLPAGTVVHVEAVDTARYHRDLGLILRPARPGLVGWDTVGLPDREPTLGLSLEAFIDYLRGGLPFPRPQVQAEWATPTRLRVALANPTPHGSALASTGNFVELRFEGTQLLDVTLGDFAGAEYGRIEGGSWRRAVAREANGVRLFLTCVPPVSRFAGTAVTFFSRPRTITTRWVVRLGDGQEIAGDATEGVLSRP